MKKNPKKKWRSKIVETYERKREYTSSKTYDPDASGSCSSYTDNLDHYPYGYVYQSIEPLIDKRIDMRINKAMKKQDEEKVTTATPPEGYVSIKTAAELNDVCEKTIRNKIKAGKLKAYSLERQIRLKRSDVLSLPKLMEKKEKPEEK